MKTIKTIKNYQLRIKNGGSFCSYPLFFFLSFYLFTFSVYGQTPTQSENYIYVQEPTDPVSSVTSGTPAIRTVQYFDGLGRPKQTKQIGASPNTTGNAGDLVMKTEYDGFGRQALDYLPVPISTSSLEIIDGSQLNSTYYQGEYSQSTWYSEKTIENSPLSRVMKQAAPGDDWAEGAGHEIEFEYLTNASAKDVPIYWVDGSGNIRRENYNNNPDKDYYAPHTLYKTVTQDENGNKIYEYKNKQGQVVLKRAYVTPDSSAGKPTNPTAQVVAADTYYIYDIYGNLVAVVPPLASKKSFPNSNIQKDLCYTYKYDERNRLVEKILPGKEVEYMVYDKQDRLVATQDANLRNDGGKWLFTKYDKFGRVVYTGIYTGGTSRTTVQNAANGFNSNNEARSSSGFTQNGLSIKYTKTAFPASFTDVLTVNYYDDYNNFYTNFGMAALNKPTQTFGTNPIPIRSGANNVNNSLKGLPTASIVRILGQDDWEYTYNFYDKRSRLVDTYKVNHLLGYTKVQNELDFRGKALNTKTEHLRQANTPTTQLLTLLDHFTYDNMERLLTHTQQINGATAQVIALNKYDKTGQLISKKVGGASTSGSDRWQEVNYRYNIRGWLTGINDIGIMLMGKDAQPPTMGDDLFAFQIQYNTLVNGGSGMTGPLYNGNIAQTFWKTGTDNIQRGYTYAYDQLNRLRTADFYKAGTVPYTGSNGEYIAYDLNGNIVNLIRTRADAFNNPVDMDILNYTYQNGNNNSNRLLKVTDDATSGASAGFNNGSSGNSNDYTYDANGNMISDLNKGITSIDYNYLNLPELITFGNGNTIEYLYNAMGQKVHKTVNQVYPTTNTPQVLTDYLDGFQYVGGMLNFFPTAEGYVRATSQTEDPADPQLLFNYVYNYTDHLGNIRLSYTKDLVSNELKILEENNYYPFGLKFQSAESSVLKDMKKDEEEENVARPGVVISSPYNYKYNGKEFQDELGLNLYDYGARNYDPALGRWMNIDPLAEKSRRWSSYAYAYNNPIYFIDPDGMEGVGHWVGRNGELLYDDGIADNKIYLTNNTYEHQGNIEDLQQNSFLVVDNGNVQDVGDFEDLAEAIGENVGIKDLNVDARVAGINAPENLNALHFEAGRSSIETTFKDGEIKVYNNGKGNSMDVAIPKADKGNNEAIMTYWNLKNTIEHEKDHFDYKDNLPTNPSDAISAPGKANERRAIQYQRSQDSWNKTTQKFKDEVREYENKNQ